MNDKKLRVILLTHGGYEEIINLLVALERVTVVGIFSETDIVRRYSLREKIKRSIRYDGYLATVVKFVFRLIGRGGWSEYSPTEIKEKQERLCEVAKVHGVPIHFVANYHSDDAIALMRAANADLGVIFGTNILKESVFKIPKLGSINLHQGRAPYYRGGPPVFWELFNGETEVGITVHYVEPKVDTGEIILQETRPLIYDYSYGSNFELFIKHFLDQSRNCCVRMVAEAVRMIANGEAEPWPQEISSGRRYRLPIKREKDELRYRLRKRRQLTSVFPIAQEIEARED
jgi:folate-dependent phosphoribosylglycinamide formyltransferase PurN